jgi:hypothetical protein
MDRVIAGRLSDLSIAGAAIEVNELLEPGSLVTLELLAPTRWDPIAIKSSVRWVRAATARQTARMGLSFIFNNHEPLFALFEVLGAHAYNL